MELSLYQITGAFPELMNIDDITEENREQIKTELTELLQKKSNNIIGYTKNIELTINAMKEEEKRISDNRKVLENKLDSFKKYVKECMENNGIEKVQTELGSLLIAKSPLSIDIEDETKVPEEYKQEVITYKIDKNKIKDNFKATGEMLEGIKYNTNNTNLRIK